eukprot:CAMPEP_0204336810 /NCGR_PEP_ID=MMETSP0469-20131031/19813_1 /ASSEMBLY_ACC=CAM_ASM_000384 /TAXON_ID=2969 /ORGANISM="Oxyrrhis marina" /LENGTH=46 /DNA_ID= /DNA_START= /DNA_END= /DNA_ORIENTATION=
MALRRCRGSGALCAGVLPGGLSVKCIGARRVLPGLPMGSPCALWGR